tara:strand:+ start:31726 stop:32229 length:504 start_codon:yes stop_codon:yes gene_type:complete
MEPLLAVFLLIGSMVVYDQGNVEPLQDTKPKAIEYQYKEIESTGKSVSTGDVIKYGASVKHWVAAENYYVSDLSLYSLPDETGSSGDVGTGLPQTTEPYNPTTEYTKQVISGKTNIQSQPAVQLRQVTSIPQRECSGKAITILTSDLDTPRENKNQMLVKEAVLRCS